MREIALKYLRLLTVPQIWALAIDGVCIIGMPDPLFDGEDLDWDRDVNSYILKVMKEAKSEEQSPGPNNAASSPSVFTATPELLIALTMSVCVSMLERPYLAGLKEPVFNVFEKAIAQVSEEVKGYLSSISMDDIDIQKKNSFSTKLPTYAKNSP